ncbi:MAG: hypothetical protein JJU27_18890 [Gammaproteobacteria bacterium]|nr:hypothetical protein [Gammaproteobacteria bacterium]
MTDRDSRVGLRQGIRELVEEERLDDAQLARLRALVDGRPDRPSRRRWLGAAAALGGVAATGYLATTLTGRADNAQRMAEEIAYNHLALAPLDFVSTNLDSLRDAFAVLGFRLLDAQALEDVPGTLMGGRFCSVASVPAALLRYRSETGVTTVYQARHDRRLHRGTADMDAGAPGVLRRARGVEVCLCHSQGVLLAQAYAITGTAS